MKYTNNLIFFNEIGQKVLVTNCNGISGSKALMITEDDKEVYLYFSSDKEIDTLIEMLKKIKE